MAKLVMVIDKKRCIGCHTCSVMCKSENNLPNNIWWNRTITETGLKATGAELSDTMDMPTGTLPADGDFVNTPTSKRLTKEYYTLACQQCSNPPCVDVCPNASTYVKASDGTVQIDPNACIGCGACVTACPYDARVMVSGSESYYVDFKMGARGIMPHKPNTVEKCTFCSHRLDQGLNPACVDACIAAARFVGDINDPMSDASQKLRRAKADGRAIEQIGLEHKTNPSVYFIR